MYVTQAARSASQVEMMVFAHGLDLCKPIFKDRPATFITERPFKLGELVEATGRPIVLVVPSLDWERLDANRMAFGRRWHRLAQPANFNQVAAEALEHARALTGSAVPPKLQRLILAGHSRAYGFFDALAHEHASPHMRTGALSRPTHVWALDTTYSAPIADWRAWLGSREDLQATVVFRHGKYHLKGSTIGRELATGIRGKAFMKLAAASNGRLEVMPVAAGQGLRTARIPAAFLPRLLGALPAVTTSGEDEREALDESFRGWRRRSRARHRSGGRVGGRSGFSDRHLRLPPVRQGDASDLPGNAPAAGDKDHRDGGFRRHDSRLRPGPRGLRRARTGVRNEGQRGARQRRPADTSFDAHVTDRTRRHLTRQSARSVDPDHPRDGHEVAEGTEAHQ